MKMKSLRTAIGTYGHTKPLKDGTVTSTEIEMIHFEISPTPVIFRRMVRDLEFDVAEMAFATYLCARAHGKEFTGVPIFLTRAFYHAGIFYNRRSGIASPSDLARKRIGVRSYTFTPGVWTRGILQSQYDLDLDSVTWVLSGDEHVEEYVAPPNVVSHPNGDLPTMLASGEIDAAIAPGPVDSPDVRRMFDDSESRDADWHRRTGIYPISHLLVVRNDLLDNNAAIADELFKMFDAARSIYVNSVSTNGSSSTEDKEYLQYSNIVGSDAIQYSYESAEKTIEALVGFAADQRVIPERVEPAAIFPAETLGW